MKVTDMAEPGLSLSVAERWLRAGWRWLYTIRLGFVIGTVARVAKWE